MLFIAKAYWNFDRKGPDPERFERWLGLEKDPELYQTLRLYTTGKSRTWLALGVTYLKALQEN